jgi:hypothetical protein
VARLLERALREAVAAEKGQAVDVTCKHCNRKSRPVVQVPDWNARVNAWKFLLEQTDGRAPQAAPQKPKVTAGSLEELSDEELLALINAEVVDGEVDGGAAEEAA